MYIQRKELGYFQQSLRKEAMKSNADQEVGLELCYLIPNIGCTHLLLQGWESSPPPQGLEGSALRL